MFKIQSHENQSYRAINLNVVADQIKNVSKFDRPKKWKSKQKNNFVM